MAGGPTVTIGGSTVICGVILICGVIVNCGAMVIGGIVMATGGVMRTGGAPLIHRSLKSWALAAAVNATVIAKLLATVLNMALIPFIAFLAIVIRGLAGIERSSVNAC